MTNINELSSMEKRILTLAAEQETTILSFKFIHKKFNIDINEVEKIVNGLIEKGMAQITRYNSDPPDLIYCKMEYWISKDQYVDLKKLEDDYIADMALRDRVCP